jgi:heterodisulfide reductase subunit A-like polyferredoxin
MKQRVLYCHCAYARVVPEGVKQEVLAGLAASALEFEAVPDLCEMSAKKDPRLAELVESGDAVQIAACYPRAVKWLFSAAGVVLPEERVRVLNMREQPASDIVRTILEAQA